MKKTLAKLAMIGALALPLAAEATDNPIYRFGRDRGKTLGVVSRILEETEAAKMDDAMYNANIKQVFQGKPMGVYQMPNTNGYFIAMAPEDMKGNVAQEFETGLEDELGKDFKRYGLDEKLPTNVLANAYILNTKVMDMGGKKAVMPKMVDMRTSEIVYSKPDMNGSASNLVNQLEARFKQEEREESKSW